MGLGELRLRSRHGTDKQAGEKKSLRAAGGAAWAEGLSQSKEALAVSPVSHHL